MMLRTLAYGALPRAVHRTLSRSLASAAPDSANSTPTQENKEAEKVKQEEKKPKRQFRDSEKRWKAKKAALAGKEKTALCPQHVAGGKCENPNCSFAHSLGELKSPAYLDQAVKAATTEQRPITAGDLLFAKAEQVFRRGSGYNSLLSGLSVQASCVSVVQWSQKKLDLIKLVEKATLTVPINSLRNNWNLNPTEVTLLKHVVGPRYDPETDSFKLIKRNRKPYIEEANEEVVYDSLIQNLVQIVKEVKNHAPQPYVDSTNVTAVTRYPKVAIRIEGSE